MHGVIILYTITAGEDYTEGNISFTFEPDNMDNRSMCKNLTIRVDSVVENNEIFEVRLVKHDASISQEISNATITIMDSTGNVYCNINSASIMFALFSYHDNQPLLLS